jgi:hypothetical protein
MDIVVFVLVEDASVVLGCVAEMMYRGDTAERAISM